MPCVRLTYHHVGTLRYFRELRYIASQIFCHEQGANLGIKEGPLLGCKRGAALFRAARAESLPAALRERTPGAWVDSCVLHPRPRDCFRARLTPPSCSCLSRVRAFAASFLRAGRRHSSSPSRQMFADIHHMVVGFSPLSLPVPHLHTQRSLRMRATASCRHPEAHWLCLPGQALKGQFTQLVMDDQHHFEGTTNTDGVTFDGGWVSQPHKIVIHFPCFHRCL